MTIKDLTYTALFTALIIVLGIFPPITIAILPVPLVIQNFGVLLAATLLGPKRATLSVLVFLILVALGLPFLTGGRGGIGVFFGPTSGYLLAWLGIPIVVSLTHRFINNRFKTWYATLFSLIIGGIVFVDIIGSLGVSLVSHLPYLQVLWSNIVFLPGDLIKVIVCFMIYQRVKKHV
ncbi:biotin transporter BioY [Holzapfeliella sp. He02]|uniref:Biotin transporter n=1 Tax=Holzapfeliella saturejae TaxID=3082953 RepID=A0ABU8SHQ9_9LACO